MIPPSKFYLTIPPEHGGDALLYRWRRKILYNRNWIRLYWLSAFGLIELIAIIIWAVIENNSGRSLIFSNFFDIWMYGTVIVFFAIRVQLASLPALVALQDFTAERWDSIRTTTATAGEVFRKIIRYVAYGSVLPASILVLIEILVIFPLLDNPSRDHYFHVDIWKILLIFLNLIALNSILTSFSFILGLIMRKPFWAVIGALSPLFFIIISGTGFWLTGANIFDCGYSELFGFCFDFMMMLVVPEGFFMMVFDDYGIHGPSGAEYTLGSLAVILITAALISWGIFYLVLKKRRG